MEGLNYQDCLAAIVPVLQQAGEELAARFAVFERSQIEYKSAHELVTAADRWSEQQIIAAIQQRWPEHHILAEESGDSGPASDYVWVIDPLDGSTNFSMHNPLWALSVALCYRQQPVLAAVYLPMLGEMYTAIVDDGAKLNGRLLRRQPVPGLRPLHAFCHGAEEDNIIKAMSYLRQQKLQGFDCRQPGSAAAELAFLAAGRLDSMVMFGARPWDVAGGVLLAREAGAKVSDLSGHDWSLVATDLLAAAPEYYEQVKSLATAS